MKKLLLSFLLCSWFIGYAQDWNPFPLGQKSFYNIYKNDTTIHVLHVDTIFNRGSFQTMFFNYNDENYAGCYENVYFNPSFGLFSTTNQQFYRVKPDSITLKNDSMLIYFASANPQYHDSILFLAKSNIGTSWFSTINLAGTNFNKLQFTCDSIYFDTIVGNTIDSLKVISVQAYDNTNPVSSIFDNQKIILSKNYGFKTMIVFSGELNTPARLIGFSTTINQEGFNYPDFTEYFHLNAGDVVIWREDFQGDILNPSYTKYYKDSIMSSFLSNDSVYYYIEREQTSGSTSTLNYKYLRENFEWLDKPTSLFLNSIAYSNYLWETYPIYPLTNNNFSREVESYGFNLDTTDCQIYQTTDFNIAQRYNTKVGFSHSRDWGWHMKTNDVIGWTINGISEGANWKMLITNVKENTINNPSVSIYPNPSPSGNFTLESEQAKWLEIMSIDGKTVFSQHINQSKTAINTNLPQGLYFAKITFENNKQTIQKLVITD